LQLSLLYAAHSIFYIASAAIDNHKTAVMLSPRGQNFGLGLGLGLEVLASAWPRSRCQIM